MSARLEAKDVTGSHPRMRIGLRMISSRKWRGGINYIINLTKACYALPTDERPEIFLLPYDEDGERIAATLEHMVSGIHPFAKAGELHLDLVYPATQLFEAPIDAPWAAWIPDWQCKHMPELFDDVELRRRDSHFKLLATRAPLLVLSSSMATEDSQHLYGERLVPIQKLTFPAVVESSEFNEARRRLPEIRKKYGVPEKYFLVANQWWRHKNHHVVFKALERTDDPAVFVVFTGAIADHRWPGYAEAMIEKARADGLQNRFLALGSVDREVQLSLMIGAAAIIQPSKFEGWSTVVEEARALQKPILLSNFAVHRDQNPPLARFFDADDAALLARLMKETIDSVVKPKIADNADYLRTCARQLVDIAKRCQDLYDPCRHETLHLMADFFAESVHRDAGDTDVALRDLACAGIRAVLKAHPEKISRFTTLVMRDYPNYRSDLERLILQPLGKKITDAPTNSDELLSEAPMHRLWSAFSRALNRWLS